MMSPSRYLPGDYVFVCDRLVFEEIYWPGHVTHVMNINDECRYSVRLYGNRGTLQYINILKLRPATESLMQRAETGDPNLRAAVSEMRHNMRYGLTPQRSALMRPRNLLPLFQEVDLEEVRERDGLLYRTFSVMSQTFMSMFYYLRDGVQSALRTMLRDIDD